MTQDSKMRIARFDDRFGPANLPDEHPPESMHDCPAARHVGEE